MGSTGLGHLRLAPILSELEKRMDELPGGSEKKENQGYVGGRRSGHGSNFVVGGGLGRGLGR